MKKLLGQIIKNKYLVLLTLLSAVILASNIRYGLRTYKVPEWDEQHYMRMSTEFYRLIKYDLSWETPYKMLQIVPFRQPGYPLLILPFLIIFGLSKAYFWGIFTNALLYILSIFGIYLLSRIFLSKFTSFIASLLFAFYGWTLLHLHLTYSETASSAFIIWTIFFLIKSDLFRNRKYSVLFGLFLGLGLLVRWIILEYIFAILILTSLQLWRKKIFNWRILQNAGLGFLIALIISFYPYFQNYYWIFHYFSDVSVGSAVWQALPKAETNPLSIYSLTFYLNTFAQLGVFFFILFIGGLILAFIKKSKIKPILFTFLTAYIFSVLAPIKGDRYIVPIFPYVAILSASVFDSIKNLKFRNFLVFLTVVLSFLSFLGSTWGKGPMKESLAFLPINLPFGELQKIYLTTYSRPPYIYKISGKEILDFIEKDAKASKIKNPQVLSLFYYRPLDEPLMTYNLYNLEKPLPINNFVGTVLADSNEGSKYVIKVFQNSDYILIKSGKKTDEVFSSINYKTLNALITVFENFSFDEYYEKKKEFWIYQDSSTVTVLKKKNNIPEEVLRNLENRLIEALESN